LECEEEEVRGIGCVDGLPAKGANAAEMQRGARRHEEENR